MNSAYFDLARMINPDVRKSMLEGNYIYKAVADENDTHMIMLFIIYSNYIEPDNSNYSYKDGRITNVCRLCIGNVLDKFKLLEPYLISLERESKLIEL